MGPIRLEGGSNVAVKVWGGQKYSMCCCKVHNDGVHPARRGVVTWHVYLWDVCCWKGGGNMAMWLRCGWEGWQQDASGWERCGDMACVIASSIANWGSSSAKAKAARLVDEGKEIYSSNIENAKGNCAELGCCSLSVSSFNFFLLSHFCMSSTPATLLVWFLSSLSIFFFANFLFCS